MSDYEYRKDSGRLSAVQSKKHEKAPDYFGEIAIDINDMTKVEVQNGLYVFRLSGWKKKSKTGATFLSIAVDRFVPRGAEQEAPKKTEIDDEDVPF